MKKQEKNISFFNEKKPSNFHALSGPDGFRGRSKSRKMEAQDEFYKIIMATKKPSCLRDSLFATATEITFLDGML